MSFECLVYLSSWKMRSLSCLQIKISAGLSHEDSIVIVSLSLQTSKACQVSRKEFRKKFNIYLKIFYNCRFALLFLLRTKNIHSLWIHFTFSWLISDVSNISSIGDWKELRKFFFEVSVSLEMWSSWPHPIWEKYLK